MALNSCTTLPNNPPRTESYALEVTSPTRLTNFADALAAQEGQDVSGFLMLDRNDAAFDWRLALADLAESSLDVQYYLWYEDATGTLFLDRLIRAADRGVRVRILVDDFMLLNADRAIAGLDQHPYIEVRVFNPWKGRTGGWGSRGFEFLFRAKALNSRMHKKVIIADHAFVILGGRNMGDHYFGLRERFNFKDLDLMAIGPVAGEVSHVFDLFWNSEWSYPGSAFAHDADNEELLSEARSQIQEDLAKFRNRLTHFPLEPEDWSQHLTSLAQKMSVGPASVLYDKPLIGTDEVPDQLAQSLDWVAREARNEVLIVTPYLIPDELFFEDLERLVKAGVRVRILTNSLASVDLSIAHTGYKPYRRQILEAGAELFEMRHDAQVKTTYDTPPVHSKFLGLHSKAIIVDRRHIFVGSLNFDPRSISLNTEIGLQIEDPMLGQELGRLTDRDLRPENSWRVDLDQEDRLFWKNSDETVYREPARNFWQRVQVAFYGLFPLEDQL